MQPGHRHESDSPALKQWLQEACIEKVTTGCIQWTLGHGYQEQYSYKQISRQLYRLITTP